MTRLHRLLFSGLAVAMIGGCSGGEVGTIDYEMTGGFIGDRITVHIDPDGAMVRTRKNGDSETTQLPPAALGDIRAKVDAAGFPTLEPMYGCSCADSYLHTINVQLDKGNYTVAVDELAEYPERLKPLIDTLSTMGRGEIEAD